MTTNWESRVKALAREGKLEDVVFDANFFGQQIDNAKLYRDDVIALMNGGSVRGAFVMAYGYMRRSATALLYARGIRPTARGGHRVVIEVLGLEPNVSKRFPMMYERLRIVRNSVEYPDALMVYVDRGMTESSLEIGDDFLALAKSIRRRS